MSKPRSAVPSDGCAWVTGASSGIGRAVSLELARRGWVVAATARREAELDDLCKAAVGLAGHIVGHPGDVTDAAGLQKLITSIEMVHGPVALAFLNAGIAPYVRPPEIDLTAVRSVMEVNVMGVFNALALLMPAMARRGKGQIAVTASLAGYGGLPKAAIYGASKAALINACESLKLDCARLNIKLQVVNPGFVETPLTAQNDFPMPFLISHDEAAKRTVDGFARGSFEIAYPLPFVAILKFVNLLPYPLYFWLVDKVTGGRR